MITAYVAGYTRNISRRRRIELLSVYAEVTGEMNTQSITCGDCILKVLKDLYGYYKEDVKEDAYADAKEEPGEKEGD
jgi:hypothetical protein